MPEQSSHTESFSQLSQLELRRYEISQRLVNGGFAVPELGDAYRSAEQTLSDDIEAIALNPELQASLLEDAKSAQSALAELEPLEGILPEAELASIRGTMTNRLALAAMHFNVYGAATDEAAKFLESAAALGLIVIPEVAILPAEAEATEGILTEIVEQDPAPVETVAEFITVPETMKTKVVLTVGEKVVRIGKRGGTVRFSMKAPNRESQKDYTDERRRAFLYVALNPGKQLVPGDVYKAAIDNFDTKNPEHLMAVSEIRRWIFEKLKFRNSPLIMTNDKRGSGSRWWTNPDMDFIVNFDHRAELPMQSDPTKSKEVRIVVESDIEIETPRECDFFLSAHHLAKFNALLEESGIPVIAAEVCKDLEQYAPNLAHLRGDNGRIVEYRIAALERVKEFISDETELFTFLDSVSEDDARYKFVDFISGLDEEQRAFVERLFRAAPKTVPALFKGAINGTEVQYIDGNGDPIYPLNPHPAPVALGGLRMVVAEELAVAIDEEEAADAGEVEAAQATVEIADEEGEEAPAALSKKETKLQESREAIQGIIQNLLERKVDMEKTYSGRQIDFLVERRGLFNRRTIDKVVGGKLLARVHPDKEFTFREIILAHIYSDKKLQRCYEQHKKDIDTIIDTEIAAARQTSEAAA